MIYSSVPDMSRRIVKENLKSNIVIDSSKIILPQPADQGSFNCSPPSPLQLSGLHEGEGHIKINLQQSNTKQPFKVLQLNLTSGDYDREEDPGRLIKTHRTIESRIEEGSFHKLNSKEEAVSLKNLSPRQKRQRFSLDDIREQLEVAYGLH